MVRRHRPQAWHLRLTGLLIFIAIAASLYMPQLEEPPPPSDPFSHPGDIEPQPAANRRALANALYTQATAALEEQGILPTLVQKSIGSNQGGEPSVDTVAVRVPIDLPLEEVNLQLSRLVRRAGGQVIGAVDAGNGAGLSILAGLDGAPTTLFTLHRDRDRRRAATAH